MTLFLLAPSCLPDTWEALLRMSVDPAGQHAAGLLGQGCTDELAFLAELRRLPAIPHGVDHTALERTAGSRRQSAYDRYDAFFDVRRVSHSAPQVFSHSMLIGCRDLLEEAWTSGSGLSPPQWRLLWSGMRTAVGLLFGSAPDMAIEPPRRRSDQDPVRRWRVGHRTFFVLTQTVVVGLRCFLSAAADADWPTSATALDFATTMLHASVAGLRFTAAFSTTEYAHRVKPSMPQGFSGLMSADHAHLVGMLPAVGRSLGTLPPSLQGPRDAFVNAVERAYANHRGVCSRFDGDRRPSLRMSETSSATATEVLDRLAESRCRPLRTEVRTNREHPHDP